MGDTLFPRGVTIRLSGTEQRWLCVHRIEGYDYESPPATCPLCGGVAIPWGGWVHCDGKCLAITRIATGEVLLPIEFDTQKEDKTNG